MSRGERKAKDAGESERENKRAIVNCRFPPSERNKNLTIQPLDKHQKP